MKGLSKEVKSAIIIGVTHATQPIFSYNYGAQKYRRIRQLFLTAALTTIVIGAIGSIISLRRFLDV